MTYEALARKKRPRNFQQVVGQDHVLQALIHGLSQNRLHHAYLFTGTRGVGKTTLARILAKSLNCEKGVTATPCGTCTICEQIDHGRCIDVIEIDAASRTKVEDTRELLEGVQYMPHRSRYKVYVIDEVHMLSNHSFNALLKTLEEPPEHVKFILATTDPQKIPITVLSRCLQFHLKHLSPQQISTHLAHILDEEKISYEPSALKPIAKAANGSMRDALSLLDQAIAFCNFEISLDKIDDLLGSVATIYFHRLMDALCTKNPTEVFQAIDEVAQHTSDFNQILESLLSTLHQMAVFQLIPGVSIDCPDPTKLTQWTQQLTEQEIQLFYQIALIGRRDLPLAPSPQTGFEMVLLRMLFFSQRKVSNNIQETIEIKQPCFAPQKVVLSVPAPIKTDNTWPEILDQLQLGGITKMLASHCTLKELSDTKIKLVLDPTQAILLNEKQRERLEQAFTVFYGLTRHLTIDVGNHDAPSPASIQKAHSEKQHQTAVENMQKDPNVQAILKTFNAQLEPEAVTIIKT
jgi:DNA polymerase III subunit gamma/tau